MGGIEDQVELIRRSGLFDAAWYLRQYPDVAPLAIDPIEHYLLVGAALSRDPGAGFSTRDYLAANPDVAAAAINPLVHYIDRGRSERRARSPGVLSGAAFAREVDVVVPVHGALSDVKACLASLRDRRDGCRVRVIVVNDGSDAPTTCWLSEFCREAAFDLIQQDRNLGYTRSVNAGMRASTAPYVVLLNSDTIVTRGWLRGLLRCIDSAADIGIVGPLSNAASWQNVPELRDASGEFAVNALPEGLDPDAMARLVAGASRRRYPRTPFVNGFCFAIAREVIDAIGCMDEENFPLGYGEENDYCIRAADAGFELAIADDAFVFHAKSRSFGHQRRKELSRQGAEALRRKHTPERYSALLQTVKRTADMDDVRQRVRAALERRHEVPCFDPLDMRVLFLLPVGGGGGGAHSVVQEAMEMRRLGVRATVAVRPERVSKFREQYPDVPGVGDLFVGFTDADVLALAADHDVVVGTIYWSMDAVERIGRAFPHIVPAYYVQDYEPLFAREGSAQWEKARASYERVPGAVLFAKTHWIVGRVAAEHGVVVHRVEPSVDHAVYRPVSRQPDGRIHVAAMIRPQTPWRGAARTMRVLSRLAARCPGALSFHLFGCAPDSDQFRRLETGFEFQAHGALLRTEVASLLARSDVFVDLSDYQAFGRTAVEAMACGCVAVVPVHGGADEYATPDNALMLDPLDEDACVDELERLVGDRARLKRLRLGGLLAAARYTPHGAAVSELAVLGKALAMRRQAHPVPDRRRLRLLPSSRPDGVADWSGHVRVLLPYRDAKVLGAWSVEAGGRGLPEPGACDVVVIQPGARVSLADLQGWAPGWRAAGGRIVCDIDERLHRPGSTAPGTDDEEAATYAKADWLAGHADVTTVATPRLAARFRRTGRAIRLVPDRLDGILWGLDHPIDHHAGRWAKAPSRVRLGYVGMAGNEDNLDLVTAALARLKAEFGERLEVEMLAEAGCRAPAFCMHVGFPRGLDYPGVVGWLRGRVHWDIGIIADVADAAVRAGPRLAFPEHAALDMAIVCSDAEAHADIARHERNALIVPNTQAGWFAATRRLIEDPALRRRLAVQARTGLDRHDGIDNGVSGYLDMPSAPGP